METERNEKKLRLKSKLPESAPVRTGGTFFRHGNWSRLKNLVCFALFAVLCQRAEAGGIPQKFDEGKGGALLCRGNFLYAALENKLCVYDVSSPLKPMLLSSIPSLGNRQFALAGNILYLSCRNRGVQVFDVTKPQAPKELSHFYPVELATGLTVSGNVLGVAQRVYGVELFDVTDPGHPRFMGRLKTGEAQSAVFFGKGKIAIGDWGTGMAVIGDVSNPASPRSIGRCTLSGRGDGVAIRGDYLFAATGGKLRRSETDGHGLEIFDISHPKKPVQVSRIAFPLNRESVPDWWQVLVTDKTAFVADSYNGVYRIDISDLKSPKIEEHWLLPQDAVSRIAMGNGVIYISGHKSGLYLVPCAEAMQTPPPAAEIKPVPPMKSPEVPGLSATSVPGFVWSLTTDGSRLYASCGEKGLREYRIEAGGSLTPGRIYDGNCFDCKVHESLLFMARDSFFDIFDRKNGRLLSRTPSVSGKTFFRFQLYDGGKLLVSSSRTWQLQFWDVSDPSAPKLICSPSGGGILYDDMLPEREINGLFPVNWHAGFPIWYKTDRTPEPAFCKLDKLRRVSNQMCGITACRGKFLLFAKQNKALLLDPNTPEQYTFLDVKHGDGIPSAEGNIVALSERRSGSVTLYAFDGKALVRIPERCYKLPFTVTGRTVFHRGKVYIPAGTFGIYRENNIK